MTDVTVTTAAQPTNAELYDVLERLTDYWSGIGFDKIADEYGEGMAQAVRDGLTQMHRLVAAGGVFREPVEA